VYAADAVGSMSDCNIIQNTAGTEDPGWGGGVNWLGDNLTLSDNTVQGNIASTGDFGWGGGIYTVVDRATLNRNTVISNTATMSPTAPSYGGGLYIFACYAFSLTNNLVADNHANTEGSGLWLGGDCPRPASGHLLHSTIADNRSSGEGVLVGADVNLWFTNTIIAGHHSVGISVTAGSTASLEATLWHDNAARTGGAGAISTGTINLDGDPTFVDPSAWDYHIQHNSPAMDEGVDAGVPDDIDREVRPNPDTSVPDLGADEFHEIAVYLPLILRNR
jgi:hypothetical protein